MVQRLAKEKEPVKHRVPTLHFAGAADRLVPPDKVRETAARSVNPATKVVELSLANGHAADYGHIDLLLGQKVETEVFPHIEDWLSQAQPSVTSGAALN